MTAHDLTPERLRELLHYDPERGTFTRILSSRRTELLGQTAGHINSRGYTVIKLSNTAYRAHRLAWLYMTGEWPKDQIDHINGVRSDNRWSNLREASNKLNVQNQRHPQKNNKSSKLLGAYRNGNKWRSQIQYNGSILHIGCYDTPEEAHAAYLEAKRRLHEGCTI